MIWIDKIQDLQYYHQPPDAPCYCELLAYPSDLMLQGNISQPYSAFYGVVISVYTPDGLILLENATPYFGIYWAQNPITGQTMFNIRLNTFSPAMCSNECWILRVTITNTANNFLLWDKWTERYCQVSCCDVPRGITIEVEGMIRDLPTDPHEVPTSPPVPTSFCGEELLRIRTVFDCYDNFTGEYYGTPGNVYSGTPWQFEKVSNINAKIAARPRTITRQESYNCRLQRSESFRPFLLESIGWEHGLFPPWKMNELENGFHAPYIYISEDYINETEYKFSGGEVFAQPYRCWELFRLNATLQDCTKRQIFGCGEDCSSDIVSVEYLIPQSYAGTGFFSENKQYVAENYNELLQYFLAQPGVESVVDTTGDYPNTAHSFIAVGNGYIPQSFYFDQPIARNRVFGSPIPIPITVSCEQPIVGALSMVQSVCETPVLGIITMAEVTPLIVPIYGVDTWEVLAGQSTVSNGIGNIHLEIFNPSYPVGSPANPTTFGGEIIASIDPEGRPSVPVFITNEQNENLPENSAVAIEPSGIIRWFGLPTAYDETGSFITIIDLIYTL